MLFSSPGGIRLRLWSRIFAGDVLFSFRDEIIPLPLTPLELVVARIDVDRLTH